MIALIGGTERHRRGDDFTAGFKIRRNHADVQRGGAGIHRGNLEGLQVLVRREVTFELRDARARPQPCGFHARDDFVDLGLLDQR